MVVIFSELLQVKRFDFEIVEDEEFILKISSSDFNNTDYFIMFNSTFRRVNNTEFYFYGKVIDGVEFYLGFHKAVCKKYKAIASNRFESEGLKSRSIE